MNKSTETDHDVVSFMSHDQVTSINPQYIEIEYYVIRLGKDDIDVVVKTEHFLENINDQVRRCLRTLLVDINEQVRIVSSHFLTYINDQVRRCLRTLLIDINDQLRR